MHIYIAREGYGWSVNLVGPWSNVDLLKGFSATITPCGRFGVYSSLAFET